MSFGDKLNRAYYRVSYNSTKAILGPVVAAISDSLPLARVERDKGSNDVAQQRNIWDVLFDSWVK